jgi:hypothetical protein
MYAIRFLVSTRGINNYTDIDQHGSRRIFVPLLPMALLALDKRPEQLALASALV